MESGQVFKVDAQAAQEIGAPELAECQYSIVADNGVTSVFVRASKWADGKPQRGRPRTFPRKVVARLLGELNDASLLAEPVAATAPVEQPAVVAPVEALEKKAEDLISKELSPDEQW